MRRIAQCVCGLLLAAMAAGPVGCPGTLPGPLPPHARPATRPARVADAVKPFAMGVPDVVLLITGAEHGRLEVCNCTGPMTAGLARRSGLVESYRGAFPHTITLDAGDVIWIEPEAPQNRYVLEGYRRIGYDAIVLGDHEWSCPPATLASLLSGSPQTYLATNVRSVTSGQKALPTTEVFQKQWGGVKLAVVSALAADTLGGGEGVERSGLSVSAPEALGPCARALKAQGYSVVLVAHGDSEFAEACAAATGADLIIRGDTTQPVGHLLQAAGKPMVKVGGSEVVGVVALRMRDGAVAGVEYRMEIVDTRWPIDSRLLQLFGAYSRVALRAMAEGQDAPPVSAESPASCGACHAAAYKQWSVGPHARAYTSLVGVGSGRAEDCLPCHTSFFGKPGGFVTAEKTPAMAGVNCQDCHRRTGADCRKKDLPRVPVSQDVCASCHTPLADPGFGDGFAKKLATVRCPRGASAIATTQASAEDVPGIGRVYKGTIPAGLARAAEPDHAVPVARIRVMADGQVFLDGRPVSQDQLFKALEAAAAKNSKRPVFIHPAPGVKSDLVVKVFSMAVAAGHVEVCVVPGDQGEMQPSTGPATRP